MIVPVPLHRVRLWQRGYNQAGLLAQALAKERGGPLGIDWLERHRATRPLGGLGRAERATLLAEAIRVRRGAREAVAGRQIVLVDDVLTSGATSEACARALKSAGARSVVVACFARVVGNAPMRKRPGPTDPGRPA